MDRQRIIYRLTFHVFLKLYVFAIELLGFVFVDSTFYEIV